MSFYAFYKLPNKFGIGFDKGDGKFHNLMSQNDLNQNNEYSLGHLVSTFKEKFKEIKNKLSKKKTEVPAKKPRQPVKKEKIKSRGVKSMGKNKEVMEREQDKKTTKFEFEEPLSDYDFELSSDDSSDDSGSYDLVIYNYY